MTESTRLTEPIRLREKDWELSDLGRAITAQLCNHHSQLYMLSCQGGGVT